MDPKQRLVSIALLLLFARSLNPGAVPSQSSSAGADSQNTYLTFSKTVIAWPAPESLMKDLRGNDAEARRRAATAIGVEEPNSYAKESPDESLLRYASLGTDSDQQAVIAVEYGASMLYGAVGVQRRGTWERVATFYCWCKYGQSDLLGEFIRTELAPDGRSELIVHASGGGSGLYEQDESHFRYYRGELRRVLYFENQFRECDILAPGPFTCHVQRRWFYHQPGEPPPAGYLVEAQFSFRPDGESEAEDLIDDLELKHVKNLSCRPYMWSSRDFLYKATGAFRPCQPPRRIE